MHRVLFFLLFILAFPSLHLSSQECYHLVWAEEFNKNGPPDPSNWGYDLGDHGWGNNELQNYTNSLNNAWVQDGKLFLKAIKSGSSWTSARLVTRHKRDFLYGRIEVRAKLPTGRGTWPAIWMLPTDWEYGGWPDSGEIDIMEHVGYDPGVVHGTVHTKSYNHRIGTQVGSSMEVPEFNTAFHTYAIEWDPDEIKFFIDQENYFSFANDQAGNYATWPFDKRFHLILNIAIGGDWGGAQGIDPDLTGAVMEIDYVRVYSTTQPPIVSGPDQVPAGTNAVFEVPQNPGASYAWNLPPGVSIISGGSSNKVTVAWGQQSGNVSAVVTLPCGSVETPPKFVEVQLGAPEEDPWEPPMHDGETSWWYENPTEGNQFDIALEEGDTHFGFNIQEPANNPSVSLDFPGLMDLSGFRFFGFNLKIPGTNPPRVVRLDLIDHNGNNNQHEIFRVNQFQEAGAFHYYIAPISPAPGFDLSSIRKMTLYVNYGLFGVPGPGEFWLRNIVFAGENPTGTSQNLLPTSFKIHPNPASRYIRLPEQFFFTHLRMTDLLGKLVVNEKNPMNPFPVSHLRAGVYLLQLSSSTSHYFSKVFIAH